MHKAEALLLCADVTDKKIPCKEQLQNNRLKEVISSYPHELVVGLYPGLWGFTFLVCYYKAITIIIVCIMCV